jgi:hypothetical protein
MKRNAILCLDILVSFIIYEWSAMGRWLSLFRFTYYHSRGDVWLPTPPAAIGYIRGIVTTGSIAFAIFFVLASALLYLLAAGRAASTHSQPGAIFYDAFYGSFPKLLVKYFSILSISFVAPFFYSYMRRFHRSREFCIVGGAAISILLFISILAAVGVLVRSRANRAR